MENILSPENKKWIEAYRKKYSRPPRILLVGNIANNAYNNAKILSQVGLDCDVISYDYYHIMGCPEWEDADISGRIKDHFRPIWYKINLGGFERPKWFAQGPLDICIDYLIARREGKSSAKEHWERLLLFTYYRKYNSLHEASELIENEIKIYLGPIIRMLPISLVRILGLLAKKILKTIKSVFHKSSQKKVNNKISIDFYRDSLRVIDLFENEFTLRQDKLILEDLLPYATIIDRWRQLFGYYDIIIGFSTDPFIPLLANKKYFAIEHGTIRTIPFETNGQGRRTALAYNQAQHCFVTNFDCAGSAEILAPGRHTLINHPYDEDRGLEVTGSSELRRGLCKKLDADFLIFHPARQDWVEGTGYADKKNEVLLNAFIELRKSGLRVGMVACEWGSNVKESKKLLKNADYSRHVEWTSPMAVVSFERMCHACDVVADQFKLGAFGGVVFKAMAVGMPIITYLNNEQVVKQYPKCPPVINCQTSKEIVHCVQALIANPEQLQEISKSSRKWIKDHHGKAETINAQVSQFRHHYPA